MTLKMLKQVAKEYGIKGISTMDKPTLEYLVEKEESKGCYSVNQLIIMYINNNQDKIIGVDSVKLHLNREHGYEYDYNEIVQILGWLGYKINIGLIVR